MTEISDKSEMNDIHRDVAQTVIHQLLTTQ